MPLLLPALAELAPAASPPPSKRFLFFSFCFLAARSLGVSASRLSELKLAAELSLSSPSPASSSSSVESGEPKMRWWSLRLVAALARAVRLALEVVRKL